MLLASGISLTLVDEADGWRFSSWSGRMGADTPAPPSEADRKRTFNTVEAAADFFRTVYQARV